MNIVIQNDDLKDGAVLDLLQDHLDSMYHYSPPGSVHALNKEEARSACMTFWSARMNDSVVACGALKKLSDTSGEVKSMKTRDGYLRLGLASGILDAIVKEAISRQYAYLYLETGSDEAFRPAIEMYIKQGFVQCGPFGDYRLDPYSQFYSLHIAKALK